MKNKGYTLMELLGVIIILALVITLIFPSIINFIKNSTDKTDEFNIELIENASDLYIDEYIDNFPKKNGNKFIIEIEDLLDLGYLPNSNDEDINNKCIQVTYSNEFKYELKDSGTCEEVRLMCEAVEEATTGNIPEGKYEAGDEYICEVKKGTNYRFFILSTEGDNVNLILDRNINSDGTLATEALTKANAKNGVYNLVAWYSSSDSNAFGPVTAMDYLYNATKDWINTNEMIVDTFTDNTGATHNMKAYNTYARMPYKSEVTDFNNNNGYLYENLACEDNTSAGGPYNCVDGVNHISYIYGYWTLSSNAGTSSNAWVVDCSGSVSGYLPVYNDGSFGVRPVISIPKTSLY